MGQLYLSYRMRADGDGPSISMLSYRMRADGDGPSISMLDPEIRNHESKVTQQISILAPFGVYSATPQRAFLM
jgi:hypothetical protein